MKLHRCHAGHSWSLTCLVKLCWWGRTTPLSTVLGQGLTKLCPSNKTKLVKVIVILWVERLTLGLFRSRQLLDVGRISQMDRTCRYILYPCTHSTDLSGDRTHHQVPYPGPKTFLYLCQISMESVDTKNFTFYITCRSISAMLRIKC